ncbi:substrate-binding domain-containing protein [Geodermatophilus sp. SYSU D00742]
MQTTLVRPRRSLPRRARRAAVALTVLAATGGAVAVVAGGDACPTGDRPLEVVVAPELAPAVGEVVTAVGVGSCSVAVTAGEPADVAETLSGPADSPDVWIPDSSIWLARAGADAVPDAAPSVARSPVVLAVPAGAAELLAAGDGPDLGALVLGTPAHGPVPLALADPRRSAETVAVTLAVRALVAGRAEEHAVLTRLLRSAAPDLPPDAAALLAGAAGDTAVPVPEQALRTSGAEPPTVAVPLGPDAVQLDFPYAVLADEAGEKATATRLLDALRSEEGQQLLADRGFRAASGGPGAAAPPTPEPAVVAEVVEQFAVLHRPSRLLAVFDVSGSMASPVPGTGGSRLDVTKAATLRGLQALPPDSAAGLWIFTTGLPNGSDHVGLVDVGPLGPRPDGTTGLQAMADALAAVRPDPAGGTGLYDTTLAAVRSMRADWDPERVSAVLLLTDGRNDDPDGIGLPQLLDTLRTEADPARPVPVFAIAYGPDGDLAALSEIAAATGGAAYASQDPAGIGQILLDAVGRRLCRPNC